MSSLWLLGPLLAEKPQVYACWPFRRPLGLLLPLPVLAWWGLEKLFT
jgi:hypothetical protein